MQENVERELNLFITRAEELEKSSFLLATPKITALLQAIANSPALCKLLGNCTANFSYGEEFNRAFPERAEGQVYTSAIRLPEDPARRVSLVFCILMDIDSQKIDFYQFLASCFPGDGSYYESFNAFARELIAPFRLTLAALLQAVESGKEEIAEPVPHIAASKSTEKVLALLKQDKDLIATAKTAGKIDEKTASEIAEIADGFTAALKTGDRTMKFLNLSKAAQAGLSSTTSPLSAAAAAAWTVSVKSSMTKISGLPGA